MEEMTKCSQCGHDVPLSNMQVHTTICGNHRRHRQREDATALAILTKSTAVGNMTSSHHHATRGAGMTTFHSPPRSKLKINSDQINSSNSHQDVEIINLIDSDDEGNDNHDDKKHAAYSKNDIMAYHCTSNTNISPLFSTQESLEPSSLFFPSMFRITFPNTVNENIPNDLPTFLQRFPPTRDIPCCQWIQVHNMHQSMQNEHSMIGNSNSFSSKNNSNESPEDVLLEFASFYNNKVVSKAIKTEYKNRLFKSAKDTVGKWMLFPFPNEVDRVWNAIATKVVTGELGSSAKVCNKAPSTLPSSSSFASFPKWSHNDKYLICVYVDNFRNEDDVKRVLRELLRTDGVRINAVAGFKADFITELGIYRDSYPERFCNVKKLEVHSIFKDMLKEEKANLQNEKCNINS